MVWQRKKTRHLDDVATTAPSDADVLTYVAASGLWTPSAPAAGGGTTIEAGSVDTDGTVIFRWGIDPATATPYFDTAGVAESEAARVVLIDGVFYAEEVTL